MTGKETIRRMIEKKQLAVFITTLILIFLLSLSIGAKEPQFRLSIDNTSLEQGISTNLVLTMENARGAELVEIQGLENFDVLNKSHSTSTQIINGNMSQSVKHNYIILPKRRGEFTLKGIVEYKGNRYETNQLDLTVTERTSRKFDDLEDIFIKSTIEREEIFFGEKIALGFELYSRYNVESFGFTDQLDLRGFLIQETPQERLGANYLQLNNNKYLKYDVKKLILTPTGIGTYRIPASNFQVNISTGSFFGFSKPVYLTTAPIEIVVKPLPKEDQPTNFSGLVGELTIESSYNKKELDYEDSLTLKVKLAGSCNLDSLDQIITEEIPGFSVYETEKNHQEEIQNGQYFARKEFEIIFVPDKTGIIKIPTIEIPYFNPEIEEYETVVIEGTEIQVNGEVEEVFSQIIEVDRPTETIRIEQVNYTMGNDEYFSLKIKKTYLKTGLYILLGLVVLGLILFFIYQYLQKGDDRLHQLFKKIKKEDDERELFNLLNEMIKYRYGLSLKAASREKLESEMNDKEVLQDILEIMEYLEHKNHLKNIDDQNIKYIDMKAKIKGVYQKIC